MEEELILSTPCLVAQAQRQKWGAGKKEVGSRDCFREEQEADASEPRCVRAWPGGH